MRVPRTLKYVSNILKFQRVSNLIYHPKKCKLFQVAAGEVLCDIETDKATLDLESMEDG